MENYSDINVRFKNVCKANSEERKQTVKEFSQIITKKKRLFLLFTILGFSFLGLNIVFTLVLGESDGMGIFLSYLGIAYSVLAVFYDNIMFSAIKRSAKGNSLHIDELNSFNDVDIETVSSMQKSNISYAAINSIMETENSFLLFISKTAAMCINKKDFTLGSADDFRDFIISKSNAKYTCCDLSKRKVQRIVAFILAIVLGIFSIVLTYTVPRGEVKTATFTQKEYSVTLPDDVVTEEFDDVYICAYNNDIALYVYKYSKQDVESMFGQDLVVGMTANDFATLMNDNYYGEELLSNDDGSHYFKYAYSDMTSNKPITYYYYFAFDEYNGTYYMSAFTFYSSDTYSEYEPKVKEWMKTITIS